MAARVCVGGGRATDCSQMRINANESDDADALINVDGRF